MIDPVCRKCRREGAKLFLKGSRCMGPKCSFTRRSYAPGAHGDVRFSKLSEYGKQLREKQKAKNIYSLRETQFHNYFKKASKNKEATGEVLLQLLEQRLDNVVYRLGFAPSRNSARQIVLHGKIMVNGKKVDIVSSQVKAKDIIEPAPKTKLNLLKTEIPTWLELDKKNSRGKVVKLPSREELSSDINEELIVEFYSR